MKISTFLLLDRDLAHDSADPIDDALVVCDAAERHGIDGVWVAEHHFRPFGGMPNPAVFLAHVAARTRRLRLGPAVAALPLRHPLAVAEDYALVDRLSGGRLAMGVGAGTLDFEFEGFGLDPSNRRERFGAALDELRDAWHAPPEEPVLNVVPIRPPSIRVATNRLEGAADAGRRGMGLLTLVSPSVRSLDEIAARLARHRAGLAEGEHDPSTAPAAVALFACVADPGEADWRAARDHFGRFAGSHGMGDASLFDEVARRGTAAFGSPASVAATLRDLHAMGAREAILWLSFGGLPPRIVERSFERIANEVRPTLQPAMA